MNTQEKQVYNSAIKSNEGKKLTFLIGEKAVKTKHLDDKSVTPEKLSDNFIPQVVMPAVNALRATEDAKIADLQNQIDAIDEHGIAVSNKFGNDPHISISQKTMTDAINRLWEKIEDITGEQLQGISFAVTPEFFIGEDGADIHITANTIDTNGIFEHIEFLANGTVICEADNVDELYYDAHIDETSLIKVVAKIMGVEYTKEKLVTHYNSFWLGCGSVYTDVMDGTPTHVIPITNGMRGQYDIDAADGDHIFVIVGESLAAGFLRADMNGVEIPFTQTTVTVGGNNYVVFTSDNTYSAGIYNIDING